MFWFRAKKPTLIPERFETPLFEVLKPDDLTIFRAYGKLTSSPNFVYQFKCVRIRKPTDVLSIPPLGRTGTTQLLREERRADNRKVWIKLLALDPEGTQAAGRLTHTIHWGYFLSNGNFVELLGASLNFNVDGYSANHIATVCSDFMVDYAMTRPPGEEGKPPRVLTQTKLDVRRFWLCLIFVTYRSLAS